MTVILPFDAHNHIQMGPSTPVRALFGPTEASTDCCSSADGRRVVLVSGMAIMSTHPRDYARVLSLSQELPHQCQSGSSSRSSTGVRIIPCVGVHPWWLHELTDYDWEEIPAQSNPEEEDNTEIRIINQTAPRWVHELDALLLAHPEAAVGETGLDAFHFDSAAAPAQHQLTCPMDRQMIALDWQLRIAAQRNRPISLHCVQAFGPLMDVLSSRLEQCPTLSSRRQRRRHQTTAGEQSTPSALPPAIYFHAFGGKIGVVDQLAGLCRRSGRTQCYFGFAPVINFRSPKTAAVVRHVGLDRLVLETDHEDSALVAESIQQGIQFYAEALGVDPMTVVERTTRNAFDLYRLDKSNNEKKTH